ncbi:hypothetical protein V6M85_02125 [Sulfolobus tengchongensis]|uniref:Class III signal peptide-containing protein n=1 Tax=Sulfolobus tengchongensis TaxID=207809 RepID=A0AAX4L187_9CREN
MDYGKIIGLVVFIIILIAEFYILSNGHFQDITEVLNQASTQIYTNIGNLFSAQPKILISITRNNELLITINNTLYFPITVVNVTGKYTYLQRETTVYPHEIKNISVIITNFAMFIKDVEAHSYNLTLTLRIYNTTFSQSEVI